MCLDSDFDAKSLKAERIWREVPKTINWQQYNLKPWIAQNFPVRDYEHATSLNNLHYEIYAQKKAKFPKKARRKKEKLGLFLKVTSNTNLQ